MKKFLSIFLIALLAMCMFVSCDSDDGDEPYMTATYVFSNDNKISIKLYGENVYNVNSLSASYSGTYDPTNDVNGSYSYKCTEVKLDGVAQYLPSMPTLTGSYSMVSNNTLIVNEAGVTITLTRKTSGSSIVGTWEAYINPDNFYDVVDY